MAIFAGKFERVVLIVSSGRTGTKALAQHLSRCYENVYAVHEPRPSWRLKRASAKAMCGRLGREELAALLARSRRRLVEQVRAPIYVESNPFLGGFLEAFGAVFENPYVVHVVRDPRTYVRSGINWGSLSGIKGLAADYLPYWLPKPEHFANGSQKRWKQMNERERLAWYWAVVNAELNRGAQILGERYLRIRFEDLFARDGRGLKKFVEWVGLPWDERLVASANKENVNASQGRRCPPWKEWTAQEKQEVLSYCWGLMSMYGYDPEREGMPLPDSAAVMAH